MKAIFYTGLAGLALVLASTGQALAGVVSVPEPSSLALIAAGVGAVAWIRFRHRK